MEALAAVGLAGNIVQFLDFGQKLVATSIEIHRSASGSSAENAASIFLIKDFVESLGTVQQDLARYTAALTTTSQQAAGTQLESLVSDCRALATDLEGRLEKLKSKGKPGVWRSFIKGVKCMWRAQELQSLQSRLDEYKQQLEFRVILSLR